MPGCLHQYGVSSLGLYLSAKPPPAVRARECLEKLSRTLTMALLLDNAEDLSLKEICLSAFKRIDNREYSIAPLSANNQVDLTKTEDILIKNAYIKG